MQRYEDVTVIDDDDDDKVSVGSMLSNESDFYGSDETKVKCEARVARFNPVDFWNAQKWNARRQDTTINRAHTLLAAHRSSRKPREAQVTPESDRTESIGVCADQTPVPDTHIPSRDPATAKRPDESLEDFLTRLPPSIVTTETGPWIWVDNPSPSHQPSDSDIAAFIRAGSHLLEEHLSRKAEIQQTFLRTQQVSIARRLSKERADLEHDIDSLAKQYNVMCGKWMLFINSHDVDQVWAVIVQHTIHGKLGPSAKVSTVDTEKSVKAHHLICIYTEDYSDLKDVKRVLRELRRSNLLDNKSSTSRQHTIYYKCDAYTYLGIASGNTYQLKASMYNSNDLFDEMKKEGSFL